MNAFLVFSLLTFAVSSTFSPLPKKENKPAGYSPELTVYSKTIQKGYVDTTRDTALKASSSPNANVNFVNYDMTSKSVSYETFDENNYWKRNSNVSNKVSSKITSENNVALATEEISSDKRTEITNPKRWPYLGTAKMIMTYYNLRDNETGNLCTVTYAGTAFLEAPNLAVTAAHCCYLDATNVSEVDDSLDNPRFPDKIEFYFGCDKESNINQGSSYNHYAKAKKISIEYSYYNSSNSQHDWAAIVLDRSIGNDFGWYGKISNWYEYNHDIYSWGYPGDKPEGTIWETKGHLLGSDEFEYTYDLQTYGGQSGSPIFMENSSGDTYVCGIHTWHKNDDSASGGTRINSLIFGYLNSFVETAETGYTFQPLKLSVKGKSWNNWLINITNTSSHIRSVSYNTKMCNFSDARDWANLNDIETITINPYSTVTVNVAENWFATTIAVSYIYQLQRVITYADHLNINGTLEEHTNTIKC